MWIAILLSAAVLSVEIEDLTAQLHLDTGNAYLQQGLLDQAEEEFLTVLEMSDQYASAILGLGRVHELRSSWSTAEAYYFDYIDICPWDYRGYHELSGLLMETGRLDSASAMADSAFVRAPTNPLVWLRNGRIKFNMGDLESAEQWFARGMMEGEDTALESMVLLASVYRLTERGHDAREMLLPAVEGGYAPACWELAKVYLGWEDYMRASDMINRYLILSPSGYYADSALLVLEELGESGQYME